MNEIHIRDIPLQPFQIYPGWFVEQNTFPVIEPGTNIRVIGLPGGDPWLLFADCMLYMEHKVYNTVLDLGWVPEADPSGCYYLRLIKNQDWDNPLLRYKSRSKDDIVSKINHWLRIVSNDFDYIPANNITSRT